MTNKKLIKNIESWLKDYEETEEHDNNFCIDMKDDASYILAEALEKLKNLEFDCLKKGRSKNKK